MTLIGDKYDLKKESGTHIKQTNLIKSIRLRDILLKILRANLVWTCKENSALQIDMELLL